METITSFSVRTSHHNIMYNLLFITVHAIPN